MIFAEKHPNFTSTDSVAKPVNGMSETSHTLYVNIVLFMSVKIGYK